MEARTVKHLFTSLSLLAAVASSTACADGRNASAADSFHSYRLTGGLNCAPALGLIACLRRNESFAAARDGVVLVRASGSFCLSTRERREVCLPRHGGIVYAFLKRAPGAYVVVETAAEEGYSVLVVDEISGKQFRIDNKPLYSPAGDIIATVSYDVDAAYVPNRVALWSAETGQLLYQTDRFAWGSGPVGIRWSGPARLEVLYRQPRMAAASQKQDVFSIQRNGEGLWADDHKEFDESAID